MYGVDKNRKNQLNAYTHYWKQAHHFCGVLRDFLFQTKKELDRPTTTSTRQLSSIPSTNFKLSK